MKITIESRKTTWVPFIESTATLDINWRARVEYSSRNVFEDQKWVTKTRYAFTDFHSDHAIPSSQLIIMENGIPTAITQSVVSALQNRFQSEEIEDPFVDINDKLSNLEKSEPQQRELTAGLIEMSWTEDITRSIKIENKTGKPVSLQLTIVDNPAEALIFTSSSPEPTARDSPEYRFDLSLGIDEAKTVVVMLRIHRKKSIQAPTEPKPPPPRRRAPPRPPIVQQQMNQPLMELQELAQSSFEQE